MGEYSVRGHCPVRLSGERVCAEDAAIFRNFTHCNRHKPLLEPGKFLSISQFHLAFHLIGTKSRTACSLSSVMFLLTHRVWFYLLR